MQQVPKSSKKGQIHVSMLACTTDAYPANGSYLADAIMLLETQGWAEVESKTVEVRPHPGQKPTCFGWEADGAVIDGTYAFIMSSLAVWAPFFETSLPQPLARNLITVHVVFTKHDSSQNWLVQILIDSAAQRYANRTAQCPIVLAEKLARCTKHSI